ncbi:MAG: VIT1/CCC1 transporter family protein [Rickettsiales bacterium]|jgi:VIT1/CCC1 family predicted Fe2+/Mn2+ transporter|nr:VIT1/CCC1 transporter family protein [Rickettsiales bacterium]
MGCEKKRLVDRKKMRTYSKRLVTMLSIASFIGYIASLVFDVPSLNLHSAALSIVLSIVSLGLNMWSYVDHLRKRNLNNQLGIENTPGQEKLTKIHINIASSASFLIGGIIPVLPFESPIIPFVSITFFILGCAAMAANIVRTMISEPKIKESSKEGNLQVV